MQTPEDDAASFDRASQGLPSGPRSYQHAGVGVGRGSGSSSSQWISVGVFNTTGSASGCEAVKVNRTGFRGQQAAGVLAHKIRLLILMNHGHPGYTCVPRLLLFGTS